MSEIRFVTLSSETDINKTVQEALTQKMVQLQLCWVARTRGKKRHLWLLV